MCECVTLVLVYSPSLVFSSAGVSTTRRTVRIVFVDQIFRFILVVLVLVFVVLCLGMDTSYRGSLKAYITKGIMDGTEDKKTHSELKTMNMILICLTAFV